jgi:hypothetical protein
MSGGFPMGDRGDVGIFRSRSASGSYPIAGGRSAMSALPRSAKAVRFAVAGVGSFP